MHFNAFIAGVTDHSGFLFILRCLRKQPSPVSALQTHIYKKGTETPFGSFWFKITFPFGLQSPSQA